MQEILIRTNCGKDVGLGHIQRTLKLAQELKRFYKITFIIDKKLPLLRKILKFKVIELYKNSYFKNQAEDARIFERKLRNRKIKFIIIDDYRIGYNWEKKFFKNYKIVVFEDLNQRKHNCHFIIDSRWDKEKGVIKYDNLVPKSCKRLIGPRYAFINKKLKKKDSRNNILIYFGGGGDLSNYYYFVLQICKENSILGKKNKIDLIIGPLSYNYKKIVVLNKKYNFLNIIKNKYNLSTYLNRCKFAFSSSGSIIYELNYLKIPACLFALSKNQINKTSNLEDLGFFLNININKFNKINDPKFFSMIFKNFEKFKKLSNYKKIKIDSLGTKRIVNHLINNRNIKRSKSKIITKSIFKKDGFYKINDSFVNKYLRFRNMAQNRRKSLNSSIIEKHNHYTWWFTNSNKIEKYYFFKNKIISIFYHQKIKIKNLNFWYGGWMTGEINPSFFNIIKFLKFQIRITKNKSNLPWLAIIKKTNKFVYFINKKLNFNEIEDKKLIEELKKKFDLDDIKKYHFLIK